MLAACPTCGQHVADLAEHLELIARRRALYGATWQLAELKAGYRPLDDAVNVVAGGPHDDEEETE